MSDSAKYTSLHGAQSANHKEKRPLWQTALFIVGGVLALSWVYSALAPTNSAAPEQPQFIVKKVRYPCGYK